ncbi:MAG: pyrroloquinoline quinone biosynthesis peptide chaperone PqqD [Thermoleophilia bacterium]|nr:pyrroloquinoline quinone biosynthesis peptide chaperone PqqD [Thermoleophilia bacterium]
MSDVHIPRLASGVRLHRDEVRARDVLLFPEGALVLNDTAAQVLAFCDGVRTFDQVVAAVSQLYDGADVRDDVAELLAGIRDQGLMDRDDE